MSGWRDIGDVPYATWQRVITQSGGPDGLASQAAWQGASPHSALALAMMGVESRFGTTFSVAKPEQQNAFGLSTAGLVLSFPSWVDGVVEWRRRLTDPAYKNGVYAGTTDLRSLIEVYAPASDPRNNPAAYTAKVQGLIDGWGIGGGKGLSIAYGQVPHPAFTVRDIPQNVNTAWDDLGPRTIRGVVWHRMEGSLWGTDSYFRTSGENGGAQRARTDYGIGVLAMDGSANAGKILRWTDPRGRLSPWANGKLSAPYGDGLAFYQKWGVTGINRDLVSIEISGQANTALDPQGRLAIAALTAYWADQYKVPWDAFPQVPGENRSFVIWHQEFTKGTGKLCPYQVVIDETNALIAQAKSILKQYQTAPAPTPTVEPMPIPADKLVALADAGQIVRAEPKPIVATEQAVLYQYADSRSGVITSLAPVLKGDQVNPKYTVVGADGRLWYVLDNWARVEAKAFA